MLFAERVYDAFKERESSDNVVEWSGSNPDKADLVHFAYMAAKELGLIEDK